MDKIEWKPKGLWQRWWAWESDQIDHEPTLSQFDKRYGWRKTHYRYRA
jgi:hypothetical protein